MTGCIAALALASALGMAGASVAWAQDPPNTPFDLVKSSAIGLPLAQLEGAYPALDCSDNICDFDSTPRELCPKAGLCFRLTLFTRAGVIVGDQADFLPISWTQALNEFTAAYGAPKRSTMNVLLMRDDEWIWHLASGRDVSFIHYTGSNVYGERIDKYTIAVYPTEG